MSNATFGFRGRRFRGKRIFVFFGLFIGVFLGIVSIVAPPFVDPSIHGHPDEWDRINELNARLPDNSSHLIRFDGRELLPSSPGSFQYVNGLPGSGWETAPFFAFDIQKKRPNGTVIVYLYEVIELNSINPQRGAYFSKTYNAAPNYYEGWLESPGVPYFYAYPSATQVHPIPTIEIKGTKSLTNSWIYSPCRPENNICYQNTNPDWNFYAWDLTAILDHLEIGIGFGNVPGYISVG
jgi:hypothetical protein